MALLTIHAGSVTPTLRLQLPGVASLELSTATVVATNQDTRETVRWAATHDSVDTIVVDWQVGQTDALEPGWYQLQVEVDRGTEGLEIFDVTEPLRVLRALA